MDTPRPEEIDDRLNTTPYLVADGNDATKRYAGIQRKSLTTQDRARIAYEEIARQTDDRLKSCQSVIRSELVAESNRMEGYDSRAKEVRGDALAHSELMNQPVGAFVEHIKDDERLVQGLGLYKAYELADEWAAAEQRPRQDEIRSLHYLVMPNLPTAGAYKHSENKIGGSDHVTIPPWDVQENMTALADWFAQGSGDAVLDAAVVHAWLTHIHPFDDGNGRMARLLANLALVQSGFPPLLLRSVADREIYLDALAASDEGDLLPLYDLFHQALRRRLCELEKPDYVDKKIKSELFASSNNRYQLWREEMTNLCKSVEIKAKLKGWGTQVMGYPSLEDFACLENRNESGNCWFIKFRDKDTQQNEWLLWFGYSSLEMCDLLGVKQAQRAWPSLFFSRRSTDPTSVHPWTPLFDDGDPDRPDELSLAPARAKQVTARTGFTTQDLDVTDAASLIIRAISIS